MRLALQRGNLGVLIQDNYSLLLSSFHYQQVSQATIKTPVPSLAKIKKKKNQEIKSVLSPTVTHATPSITRAQSFPLLDFQMLKRGSKAIIN